MTLTSLASLYPHTIRPLKRVRIGFWLGYSSTFLWC